MANYIGWPLGAVLSGVGWFSTAEVGFHLSGRELEQALKDLAISPAANGLTTPLSAAAADHVRLIATLYRMAQARQISSPAPDSSTGHTA